MLDFNNKKETLRRLRARREQNKLMWLPCVLAELFVKLWYGLRCRLGLALSDKDGNLFGVKRSAGAKAKTKRQDDIVYVKRPFFGRLMSAVLAAAFVLMFVPEIDFGLGITVEAATISPTFTPVASITYNGEQYARVQGTDRYYFKYSDYVEKLDILVPDTIETHMSNGAAKIKWEQPNGGTTGVSNYKYEVGYVINGATHAIDTTNETEYEFTGLSSNEEYIFYVRFIASLPSYTHVVRDVEQQDPDTGAITTVTEESMEYAGYRDVTGGKAQSNGQVSYKPNAAMEVPNVTLTVNGSDTRTDCTMSQIGYNQVVLHWNNVRQTGGNDAGRYADGYNIYARNVTTETFITVATGILYSDDADGYNYPITRSNLVYGNQYQFFVEAYRDIWPEEWPGERITSSGSYTNIAEKFRVYSQRESYYRNLYIAPAGPTFSAEGNLKNKSIELTEITAEGSYKGVVIYRSKGDVTSYYSNPNNNPNGLTFREWLEANPGGEYEIKYVKDVIYPANSHPDKSGISNKLVSDVEYYYYAFSYIMKDGTPLYSDNFGRQNAIISFNSTAGPVLEATSPTDGQIQLTWDAVSDADGYEIRIEQLSKYNPDTGEVDTLDEPIQLDPIQWEKSTTYTHKRLYNKEQYRYRVVPYVRINDTAGNRLSYGSESTTAIATVGTGLDTPENVKPDGSVDGQVTITWDSVPGATGYILHYVNNSTGDYEDFTTSKTKYTQTNMNNDWVCQYSVTAYKIVNLNGDFGPQTIPSIQSGWVPVRVGQTLTIPQDVNATTADGQVTVSWSAVSGAEGYKLYFSKNGAAFSEDNAIDVTKSPYVHKGLNNGDTYSYYVKAYKTVNGVRVPSEPSYPPVSVVVGVPLNAPKDFKGTTSDGRVDLTWSAVSGAEGYILRISGTGTPQEIDLSKPGFQHTGLQNGDRYTYTVVAYKTVNGKRIFSDETSGNSVQPITITVGDTLESPKDFAAVTTDGQVALSWTAVSGANGYVLYAYGNGKSQQFDLSKPGYTHTGLKNGDSWTYYVSAYKTVNGTRTYSSPTKSITVTIGVSLNAAIDLVATAGNRQIDLTWKAVTGAEGYVVYLYNSKTMEFEPITVVSGTKYSHTGLTNGQKYTYMVAPFKTINGTRYFGDYSISVTATPSTGSTTDVDRTLNVKGTTPYGISHSEYISAAANHGAFDEPVDVYFTTNKESTNAVKDVLKEYADGLNSFIIYPFDITVYSEGTRIELEPNDGYSVTITMPIPDKLIAYRDYITVVHIGQYEDLADVNTNEIIDTNDDTLDWLPTTDQKLEVLPCAVVDIDNVWCVQFVCSKFSPFAFVIYKEHILDVSAGGGVYGGDFAGTFNSGVFLFTSLPDILPHTKRLRVVKGGKVYHIKNITKL